MQFKTKKLHLNFNFSLLSPLCLPSRAGTEIDINYKLSIYSELRKSDISWNNRLFNKQLVENLENFICCDSFLVPNFG